MMLRRVILLIILLLTFMMSTIMLSPNSARAATQAACGKSSAGFLGFPTWYKYLEPTFDPATNDCKIKFDIHKDISKVLLAVFEIILRVGGLVAVGFVIFGGFQYIISQGEPDRIKGARSTIINAMVGLAIAISATAVVNLIARTIT